MVYNNAWAFGVDSDGNDGSVITNFGHSQHTYKIMGWRYIIFFYPDDDAEHRRCCFSVHHTCQDFLSEVAYV